MSAELPHRVAELPAYWRARAATLEPYAKTAATAFEAAASELELVLATQDDEELNLTEAGAESGYHPDSIGRLLRERPDLNAGRPGAPKIRRRHLPRKPSAIVAPQDRRAGPSWEATKADMLR